ncbi:hypothetical protein GCM10029976_024610 [Kribbella albertanoniae]
MALAGVVAVGAVSATPAHAAYSDCSWGKVCVWDGWNGSGNRWEVPNCGWNKIPVYMNELVSSAKTHGNAMRLYDGGAAVYVGNFKPWMESNLASYEDDRASWVWVDC